MTALSGTHISSQIRKSISAINLSVSLPCGIFIFIGNITKLFTWFKSNYIITCYGWYDGNPGFENEGFCATGRDPKPKAGNLAIPGDGLSLLGFGGGDNLLG